MITYTTVTDKVLPIPPINKGALYRYIRHTFGDVSAPRVLREARKLGGVIRKLAEAGDHEAVRELVERINNAPAPLFDMTNREIARGSSKIVKSTGGAAGNTD